MAGGNGQRKKKKNNNKAKNDCKSSVDGSQGAPCDRRGACVAGGAEPPSYSLDSYSLLLQSKKRKLINKMEDAAL